MRVLAIDLSGAGGGAALLTPEGVQSAVLPVEVRRGRDLLLAVKGLLGGQGVDDLDLVACGIGPGSFTGIRIAVSTVATLAYAAELPVLGVGSLHGVATNAPAEAEWVLAALDARRDHVFCALFRRTAEGLELQGDYRHVPAAEAAAGLPGDAFIVGDAYSRYAEVFGGFGGTPEAHPRPGVIASVAAARFEAGEREDPVDLRPLYLRLSDPEVRRSGRES